jgi:hypothetical protein
MPMTPSPHPPLNLLRHHNLRAGKVFDADIPVCLEKRPLPRSRIARYNGSTNCKSKDQPSFYAATPQNRDT